METGVRRTAFCQFDDGDTERPDPRLFGRALHRLFYHLWSVPERRTTEREVHAMCVRFFSAMNVRELDVPLGIDENVGSLHAGVDAAEIDRQGSDRYEGVQHGAHDHS